MGFIGSHRIHRLSRQFSNLKCFVSQPPACPQRCAAILLAAFFLLFIGPAVTWAEGGSAPGAGGEGKGSPPSLKELTSGTEKAEGMWTLYHKDQRLLVDLPSAHLGKNFIVLTSIARGIGKGMVLGGMSLNSGESIVWTFQKVGDSIHVLRRNVRFRAKPSTPEADAVKIAYSDSVLYALPIQAKTPAGYLVDMSGVFLSDDQGIGKRIGEGFKFAADRSTLAKVKSFPENVEIQVAAVYSGSEAIETVADPRGVQVRVHFSISRLPEDGYRPRKADDRIGYFTTAMKDFSDKEDDQHFVRYINRWNLKKKDPAAKLSPPEKPIVFYLEKTVPVRLRPYIQQAIEAWNKPLEKLGFSNAIIVLQQGDGDDWDPEDIRYNTFRWITDDAGFAMGPTRVNPLTGEILDADIIFDASFLDYWREDYETFRSPETAPGRLPGPEGSKGSESMAGAACMLSRGMLQQLEFAALALGADAPGLQGKPPEEFILQALKMAVMHEVGHTLGLRHNFKGSTWKKLEEIRAAAEGTTEPTAASVMDYLPAEIAPAGTKQGLYFSPAVGPYDALSIEYGYKPFADAKEEAAALSPIAARCIQQGLDYATDEDAGPLDPDPLANAFDLGKDPIAYARQQMDAVAALLPKIVDRTVREGEGYQRARRAFGSLLAEYWRAASLVARIPGGVYVNRDHKGDSGSRAPCEVVPASRQRQAMQVLDRTLFSLPAFDPALLNHLAATYWNHWGLSVPTRPDYPIHAVVAQIQGAVLDQLLNPTTLARLQDSESKVPDNRDVYTLAEHLRTLTDSIFSEIENPVAGSYQNREPFISGFRRSLQRTALKLLAGTVTRGAGYPEDARSLSRLHLARLGDQIEAILKRSDLEMDEYSRAHLLDSETLVRQVLDARLQVDSVG